MLKLFTTVALGLIVHGCHPVLAASATSVADIQQTQTQCLTMDQVIAVGRKSEVQEEPWIILQNENGRALIMLGKVNKTWTILQSCPTPGESTWQPVLGGTKYQFLGKEM